MSRQEEIRQKALTDLRESQVLMLDGHFKTDECPLCKSGVPITTF
jgi:hypothetical protein